MNPTMQRHPKLKVVAAARPPAPPKLVKDVQCLLILLVFFELHTCQTKSEKDLHAKALKYYEQNVANFVNEDIDARSDEGINFLQPKERYAILTASQLMKAKASGANFTGKQIWLKAKEIRRFVVNQITPVYNSFLKMPGSIFPSGWEIDDMLEATRRKLYVDSRGIALNLTDEIDEDDEGQQSQQIPPITDSNGGLETSVDEGQLPATFPAELRTIVVPPYWQASFWTVFLWFGSPCEYHYCNRTPHPQLNLNTGNGPEPDDDSETSGAVVKKEGVPSLSRASQKRKANAETAIENESLTSGSTSGSSKSTKTTSADRELDLAERVQKLEESDRALILLKECLADADDTPEKAAARAEIKKHRERMILNLNANC